MFALVACELHTQGFFQGLAHVGQSGHVLVVFDAGLCIAGIGRQEPRDILRGRQRGNGQHDALHVFAETLTLFLGGLLRVRGKLPEGFFVAGQGEAFHRQSVALGVVTEQQEIAVIGDKDRPILGGVSLDLIAAGDFPHVFGGGLHFQHAARR